MDISQAMQEITVGELSHWKDPKEIAKMEKVGSTEEKLPRGKELKPFEGNSTNPSFCHFAVAALTEEKLPRVKELKPFEEIAKMEKVGSTEEKLPLKPDTLSAELHQKFTPDELRRMFTPDEIYEMFTAAELQRMFPLHELCDMLTVDQISQMRVPKRRKPRLTQAREEAFYKNRDGKRYSEVQYCGALEKGKKIIC